jgi:hypothetical protein
MSVFVESLKRLYQAEKVNIAVIENLKTSGKISQADYDTITQ